MSKIEIKNKIWDNSYEEIVRYAKKLSKEEGYKGKSKEELIEAARNHINMDYQYLQDDLDQMTEGQILVIADLGLWNGRRTGYKILNRNLRSILVAQGDTYTVGFHRGNIKAIDVHHDGVNYYEYREIRPEKDITKLTKRLYEGEPVSREMINAYTKSLKEPVEEALGMK